MARLRPIFQSLFLLALLGICLIPFIQWQQIGLVDPWQECWPTNPPLTVQEGNWESNSTPYIVTLNTYYSVPKNDLSFATFLAQAGDIYYVYLENIPFWTAELYNNSAYTCMLGTFYQAPYPLNTCHLIFSPGRSGWYYLLIYCKSQLFSSKLAILNATPYTVNTTQLIIISEETCPVRFLSADLVQGNYSTTQDQLYARIERGCDYVIFSEMYNELGPALTSLENDTYGFIFTRSCNFQLTGYRSFPKNETIPDDPGNATETDPGQPSSIFDGITPLFGIGVLVGLCALYKFKKK